MSAVYRGAWEDAKGETDAAAEVMRDPAQRAIYELNLEMGNNIVQSLVKTGLARNALILDETGKPFAEANLATLSETSLHTRMGDVLFGGVPAAFVPLCGCRPWQPVHHRDRASGCKCFHTYRHSGRLPTKTGHR